MSRFFLKRIALILTLSAGCLAYAQDKAEKAIQKFEQEYPQEKIHLLFNKDHYVAGENLWFKSFVFDGYSRSNISTSLFVELYDNNKKLIDKKMVPLLKGEGSGSFSLANTLQEDVYFIRAYTTWMTNFSDDFNYLQPISIYNPASPKKLQPDTEAAWYATLHPESGTFVDGIPTKFVVRLHSKGITPSEWSGSVFETGKPNVAVAEFKGFDQNVGSFSIAPVAGKQYQLTVEDKSGKKMTINLPQISPSGFNLQVQSTDTAVKYTIKTKNLPSGSKPNKILGTLNNVLVYKANIHNLSDEQSATISTDRLVNGILKLTIFDSKENVLAERICFVQPQILNIKKPNLTSNLDKAKRAKNSFLIEKNQNLYAYSVSISDGETNSLEDENSLLSSLWLVGDLNPNLIRPAQYFAKNSNPEALDALMISETWKRFQWKNIISGNFPVIKNNPESYISYKGKVMSQGKPAANSDLNLIFKYPDSGMKFHQVKTDSTGMFTLNNLFFEDVLAFSYQLNSNDKKDIQSTQVFFQPNFSFTPYKKELPSSRMKLIDRIPNEPIPIKVSKSISNLSSEKFIYEKITEIEEVKITVDNINKTKKLNEELSSPLFKGINEMVFDFVNEHNASSFSNILQWLEGRVPGLTINRQGGIVTATMRGSGMGRGAVDIFIDEMKSDPSQVAMISASEVAMIKVIRGSFGGSSSGQNGAILIYLRQGGITGNIPDNGQSKTMKDMTLKGYDKEEPFKNEIYDDIDAQSLSKDSRSTLYWNPYLPNQPKESTKINFYNNDDAKSFKVIIIGFDEETDTPLYYNDILK